MDCRKKMTYPHKTFVFCIVCSCVLLAGCRGDSLEPSEPPAELVKAGIVHTPSPIFRGGKDLITVKTIDGKPVILHENKAIVAPGDHLFQIALELHHEGDTPDKTFVTRADTSLRFQVEAEHEYLVDAVEDANGLWLWVTDITDNMIVAGQPPRELPPEQRTRPMWKK